MLYFLSKAVSHAQPRKTFGHLAFGIFFVSGFFSCSHTVPLTAPTALVAKQENNNPASQPKMSGSDCQFSLLNIFPLQQAPSIKEAAKKAGLTTQSSPLYVSETFTYFLLGSHSCITVSNKLR
jgi:hypothetical protein